jgi:hypothetical protein
MPSVRNLLMSRRTSTCFLIVDASIIAPATLRCLPSSMNDWITGAWATSAASRAANRSTSAIRRTRRPVGEIALVLLLDVGNVAAEQRAPRCEFLHVAHRRTS